MNSTKMMDEICSMLDTYKGRDKVIRTFCYTSRLIAGLTSNKDLERKLMSVSKHLSATRTTLRLMDDIPAIKSTLQYGLGKEENNFFMATLGVTTNTIDLTYIVIEKLGWLAEYGLISGVDQTKCGTLTSACWLASVYLTLIRTTKSLLQTRKIIEELKIQNEPQTNVFLQKLQAKERFQIITCIRLSLDIVHAVSTLPKGFLWSSSLKTWQVGVVGTLSSVLGLYQIFAKKNL